MAAGKWNMQKASGGVASITVADGVSNTEVVVPESGVLATQAYADGKTTLAQVKDEIRTGSNLVTSSTGVVGYGTGSGGTVTQLTSKSTAVTLNKPCGTITMHNAALAAGASVYFQFNCNLATIYDALYVEIAYPGSSFGNYRVETIGAPSSGAFYIKVTNVSGSSLSEAISITFILLKGANS